MKTKLKQGRQVKRLFLSLYLLVSLSILGIGWTLDSLWQNNVDDTGTIDAPLIALAQLLTQLPKTARQEYLDKVQPDPDYPLQLLDAKQVSLSENQQLATDRVFTISPEDNLQLQFVAVGSQVLMAGPVVIDPREKLRSIFTLAFYLLLALVALIWVWPLSRDLNILRNATHRLGLAKWDTRITLAKGSQVAPLAHTFNEMARHIGELIENQKHLSNAVSHEIRTPLARLKFALALLPQYCTPEADAYKRSEYMDGMRQDVLEMETLLQELLTYASLESQKGNLQFERIDLLGLTKQLLARLQNHQSVEIVLEADADTIFLLGDPALIERAIQNLVTNAQRFARSQIHILIDQRDSQVNLCVIDDGEGIAAEEQQKIFEPFYRSATKQNGDKGHGLGLAIIKRIMNQHQGKISLSSQQGMTRFCLSFPQASH